MWCRHQPWGSNWGFGGFLPTTHQTNTNKMRPQSLHTVGVSRMFIFTLKLQYILTWWIRVILTAVKTQIPPIWAPCRDKKWHRFWDLSCISVVWYDLSCGGVFVQKCKEKNFNYTHFPSCHCSPPPQTHTYKFEKKSTFQVLDNVPVLSNSRILIKSWTCAVFSKLKHRYVPVSWP